MNKQNRLTTIISVLALAGSIQILAAQDRAEFDTGTNAQSAAELTAAEQSPTTGTEATVAAVTPEDQMLSRPIAAESMLNQMKIYPSF